MCAFIIPRNLRDLERQRANELFAANIPDLDSVGPGDIDAAYHECATALAGGPLNILDQDTFDAAYTIIRSLDLLDVDHMAKFTTTLSHNLSVIVTSGLEELSADGRDKGDSVVASHRSAIHAYTFFLSVIHVSLHTLALDNHKAEASAKGAVVKKRGKAKAAAVNADPEDGLTSVWPVVMERIVKALGRTLKANLDEILYRSPVDKCRLIEVCVLTVARCMEDSSVPKLKSALTACLEVAAVSATRHANANGCLELTAEALFRLVKEHDHGPALAVQAAVLAAGQYDSLSLGKALLMKFAELDPEGYDEIAAHDTKPVKRAAEMLSSMAAALPAVVHAGISQLIPYFGCKTAVTVRSNLVDALRHLMEWYMVRGMEEKGSRLLQMSRQNAIQILVSRVNDVAALVRKTALNVIEQLVKHKCWPIEYIAVAARAAVARLDDGPLPAGAALSLLCTLVHMTATEKLTDTFLVGSLNRFEEHLKGMQPDTAAEGEDREDDGPQWEAGPLDGHDGQQRLKQSPQQQPGGHEDPGISSQLDIIMPTQVDDSAGGAPPLPSDAQDKSSGGGLGNMTYSQVRFLIASLKALLELSRTLAAALLEVEVLLTSDSADVVEKAIQLLTLCSQKQLQGASDSWRRVWHLVFSTSEKVRETVMDAFYNFLLPGSSTAGIGGENRCMVNRLVLMVGDLALCDQEALEELIRLAVTGTKPEESPMFGPELVRMMLGDLNAAVIRAMLLEREGPGAAMEAKDVRILAGRLSLLCSMVTRHAPKLAAHDVENMVANLKRSHTVLKDALLMRNLAFMLRDISDVLQASPKGRVGSSHLPASHIPNALTELLSVLVSSHLPQTGGCWQHAAQAAVAAIYRLHPEPYTLLRPLMQNLAKEVVGGCAPATQIARSIFLVGCIAVQQLAFIDVLAKRVRLERAAQERNATEKASQTDMDAQLGTGQAREHQFDALQEELEARLMDDGLISVWGKLVSKICHTPAMLGLHPDLASAAMATLAKFMAIDAAYCEDNCPIFFTRLTGGNVKLAPGVRCGMLVALGDLGRRHPNVMEPWTERMFVCLNDENEEIATTCLRILAHLVLSDMTKPKGHMSHVARCLVSPSAAVRDLAIRLFNSLAKKQAKGGANKVYQYLPEIISTVTRGDPMPEQDFKAMMQRLLGYVKADKLADKLKERLCERFQNVVYEMAASGQASAIPADAEDRSAAPPIPASVPGPGGKSSYKDVVREWRSLADCIALIPYSEKGLRACMELLPCYKHALGDEHVFNVYKGIAEHGRRGNRTAELKQEVAEYEARLLEAHTSLREEQIQHAAAAATAAAAAKAASTGTVAAPRVAASAEVVTGNPASGGERQQEEQQDGVETACKSEDEVQRPDRTPNGAGVDGAASHTFRNKVGRDRGQEDDGDSAIAEDEDEPEPICDGVGNDEEMAPTRKSAVRGGGEEEARTGEENGGDNGHSGELEKKALDEEDMDDQWDEAGEGGEQTGEEEEEEDAFADAEMEWTEDGAGTCPTTPLGNSDTRYNSERTTVTPGRFGSGTPMAVTPASLGASKLGTSEDDMAWSPAMAAANADRTQRENTVQPCVFPGFHIKPDPDGQQRQLQGTAWPLGTGSKGPRQRLHGGTVPTGCAVAGVLVKPDPDSPWQ
ncbi:hypothetical protein VaNZ11_001278 [Volvox africanus]|uniref:Condensin complex subunit 1 n=1 Tax=Volvox africanus TaxID=51714 RepID=A0ABQ5RPB4_9CHLO|nr:hypothetical protein VaNZ11_001278 [Volvox africanus]